MLVYHEISPESKQSVLEKGLLRSPRGDKGNKKSIAKADHVLDYTRPEYLKAAGVSRNNNNYAYICHDGKIIDIKDGNSIPLDEFIASSQQTVLALSVNPNRCFVSDLDAFDVVKTAVDNEIKSEAIHQLADDYWRKLIPLSDFKIGSIKRPEVVIPYDVAPDDINLA